MTELLKAERPEVLDGRTHCVPTGCGKVYIIVNWYEGRIFEVFMIAAKAGGCISALAETIGKLISRQAQHGIDVGPLVKHLKGISCHEHLFQGAKSCTDALARVLERDIALEAEAQPELPALTDEEVADAG